jgi:transposase
MHSELCAVYGQNVMNKGTIRQWCRMFKDGRRDVHDEERGRPSVVSRDLVQSVDQKICERRRFTISELFFVNFHCSVREYHSYARLSQVLRKMGSENAHGCAQNAKNGFGFDIFRVVPQR